MARPSSCPPSRRVARWSLGCKVRYRQRSCAPVKLLNRHTPDTPGDATASRSRTFPPSPSNPPSSPPLLLLATLRYFLSLQSLSSPPSSSSVSSSLPLAYTRPTDRDILSQLSHRPPARPHSSSPFALALSPPAPRSQHLISRIPGPRRCLPCAPTRLELPIFHLPLVGRRSSREKESFSPQDAVATSHTCPSRELLGLPVTKHPELQPRLNKSRL